MRRAHGPSQRRCTTLTRPENVCTRAVCRLKSWRGAGPDTIRYGRSSLSACVIRAQAIARGRLCSCAARTARGTLYNLVGFQTNLRFGEQKRVFSMIPGLAHAEFMRYGVMHRNTFLDSPRLLDRYYADRAIRLSPLPGR